MEKRELSYSDCITFKKYIAKALDGVLERNFKEVRDNIDSARDMLFDWRCDDEISLCDDEIFTNLLIKAVEDLEAYDCVTLFETLILIRNECTKMMQRLNIYNRITNG